MSKFLGPIHYQMYNKIKFQDEITSFLLDGNTSDLDKKLSPISKDSLENLIDQDNIHGWLSKQIDIAELRLKYALMHAENPKSKLNELGEKMAQNKDFSNWSIIFKTLNNYLLDGMPCDNGLIAQLDDDDNLFLITQNDLHSQYYEDDINPDDSLNDTCEGNHSHDHHENFELQKDKVEPEKISDKKRRFYYEMRYEFLKGYFKDTKLKVEMINSTDFKISQQ